MIVVSVYLIFVWQIIHWNEHWTSHQLFSPWTSWIRKVGPGLFLKLLLQIHTCQMYQCINIEWSTSLPNKLFAWVRFGMPSLNSMVGISSNKAIATFQALPVAAAAIAVLASGKSSLDGSWKYEKCGHWQTGDHSTVIQWTRPFHHLIIQLWTSWSNYHSIHFIISWTWIHRTKKPFSPLRKVKHPPWHLHSLHGESTANQFRALSSCSDWPWQGQFPTSAPEELMGGNCLMSFFHFQPKKKHGTSTDFRSLRSCVFPSFHIEDLGTLHL